ncbi:MAG: WecB/TagA/CpsF family glycosyltransferase [Thermogutta sp.]
MSIVDLPRTDAPTETLGIRGANEDLQAKPLPAAPISRLQTDLQDPRLTLPPPINLFNLPIVPWHHYEVIRVIDWLVRQGSPSYFITANLHYARLSANNGELRQINTRAAFIVADGMPLVWVSRFLGRPLPERVTGADLIWSMCELATDKGYRVFLFGGAPGVAETASRRLQERFPGLTIAGTAAPNLDTISSAEEARLIAEIRKSRTDILFAALGQPKGELWLAKHVTALGATVAVQIGAALDFVAGRVRRAPRVIQRLGLEWAYRMIGEPRRLLPRYWEDGCFFLRQLLHLRRGR